MENKSIRRQHFTHEACFVRVPASDKTTPMNLGLPVCGLLPADRNVCQRRFWVSLAVSSRLVSCRAPQTAHRHTLISHFTGGSTLLSPRRQLGRRVRPLHPVLTRAPPLACVQAGIVYRAEHLEGLAFHHGSCWHHVPALRRLADGTQASASHTLQHPPRGPCPPSATPPPRLASVETSSPKSYIKCQFNVKTGRWL